MRSFSGIYDEKSKSDSTQRRFNKPSRASISKRDDVGDYVADAVRAKLLRKRVSLGMPHFPRIFLRLQSKIPIQMRESSPRMIAAVEYCKASRFFPAHALGEANDARITNRIGMLERGGGQLFFGNFRNRSMSELLREITQFREQQFVPK